VESEGVENVCYSRGYIHRSHVNLLAHPSKLAGVRFSPILIAITAVLGFLTLSTAFGAPTPAVIIKMSDKPPKFLPNKITIKKGQTVEWNNNAKTLHSVDGDPSMALKPSDVSLPPGAKPFDSGFLKPDMTWDYTFKVPGTYKYTCVPHEKDGMNGEIVVK
jgi:plastocyanin